MTTLSVTSGGKERVNTAKDLLSSIFGTDPVITYLLCSMTPEARLAYLPKYFDVLLTAAAMNNAIFDEADDWKACGVLMPPGCRVDNTWTLIPAGFFPMLWNIGVGNCKRMLAEFQPLADASKAKGLAGQKDYYYVFFTGTRLDSRGQGMCSAIMKRYQDMASRDKIPIWLEATTAKSMRLYSKLGWEIVDEIVLGKGKANADGLQCKGGEGVRVWGMVWRPKTATKQ